MKTDMTCAGVVLAVLRAYTAGGAWAAHREGVTGRLVPGLAGDLVLLVAAAASKRLHYSNQKMMMHQLLFHPQHKLHLDSNSHTCTPNTYSFHTSVSI